ncbi:hypothetical protein LTR86_009270 [Recurvomyces mirabilis]|nr:hypothetical protein LTR86_009270 [Recurvomyces mirabilis]
MGHTYSAHEHRHRHRHRHRHHSRQEWSTQTYAGPSAPNGSGNSSSAVTTTSTKPSDNFPQLTFYLESTREFVHYYKATDLFLRNGQWIPRPPRYAIEDLLDAFDEHAATHPTTDISGKLHGKVYAFIRGPAPANVERQAALAPSPGHHAWCVNPTSATAATAFPAPNIVVHPAFPGYQHAPRATAINTEPWTNSNAYNQAAPNITINAERGSTVGVFGLHEVYRASQHAPPNLVINAAESAKVFCGYGANAGYPAFQTASSGPAANGGSGMYQTPIPSCLNTVAPSVQHPAIEQAQAQKHVTFEPEHTGRQSHRGPREGRTWPTWADEEYIKAD